ncbi:hypothetical protein HDU97_002536 [Phlyctochytrium planicorne]|nr:hypothetical protein HDU97_002536 [Phlyctochytrium planicorne]
MSSTTERPAMIASLFIMVMLVGHGVLGGPCVVFDADDRLYVFGVPGSGDGRIEGGVAAWGDEKVLFTATSKEGRPPFDGPNTQCYFSQYINTLYVVNGDKANPYDVHFYQVSTGKWSTQKAQKAPEGGPTIGTAVTALDHNTNVFYSYDVETSTMYALVVGDNAQVATTETLSWKVMTSISFGGLAQGSKNKLTPAVGPAHNHLHYINTPGAKDGEARIFVIHYNYEQPELQFYNGGPFPQKEGVGFMTFQKDNNPSSTFGFAPYDGSGVYLVDTDSNSTIALPPPPKEVFVPGEAAKQARFAAGTDGIVVLHGDGTGLAYVVKGATVSWATLPSLKARLPAGDAVATSAVPGTGSVTSGAPGPSASASVGAVSTSKPSGAGVGAVRGWEWVVSVVMGALILLV